MALTIDALVADDLDVVGAPTCRRLFSIEQASGYAGVSLRIILHWIRIGRLRSYRVHSGLLRIDELELDECLACFNWLPCEPRG